MGARAEVEMALLRQQMINHTKTWAAQQRAGEKAVEYWKSLAPVGDIEHALKSGFIVHPGDYQESIRARHMKDKDGGQFVRVQAHDFKAHWIENGSVHNPNPTHPCADTRSYMQSQGFRG